MEEKFYVTEEGLQDLKKQLDELIHVTRNEVIEELKAARAQGAIRKNGAFLLRNDRRHGFRLFRKRKS